MDDKLFDYLRTSIDQLATTQQLLLACMEVKPQTSQTPTARTAGDTSDVTMDVDQRIDVPMHINSDEFDERIEPLTIERISEINRVASAKKSTWATLRKQYPPGNSMFVPLRLSDRERTSLAAVGVTTMDADLAIDEAYSQAAIMAAYGVELLRMALSGRNTDRRRIRQASNIFTTLCGTLMDTRYCRRNAVTKMIEARVASYKHTLDGGRASSSITSTGPYEMSRPNGIPIKQQSPNSDLSAVQRDGLVPSTRLPAQSPGASDNRQALIREEPATVTTLPPAVPSPVSTAVECASETGNTPIVDLIVEPTEVRDTTPDPIPTISYSRQDVICDALLRQGVSESGVGTYFKQRSIGTNRDHDSVWKRWVDRCAIQNLDLLKRSVSHLDIYISEGNWTEGHICKMRAVVQGVWTIVEGQPAPAGPKHVLHNSGGRISKSSQRKKH
ncbi:hypothetical protein FBU31_000540 [Coemansia sp. 'formosensis']|nr:hypothetical protein FBU31_000540 [Coemansia sp. 'formosensis']